MSPPAKALAEKVIEGAKREADDIIAAARKIAEETKSASMKDSETRKTRIVEAVKAEYDRLKGDELTRISRKYAIKIRSLKWELIDEILSEGLDILEKEREGEDYPNFLEGLIDESVGALGAEKVIAHVDLRDAELVNKIIGKILNGGVIVETDIHTMGGVVVTTTDGAKEVDNTLEARYKLRAQGIREKIWELLYGDLDDDGK